MKHDFIQIVLHKMLDSMSYVKIIKLFNKFQCTIPTALSKADVNIKIDDDTPKGPLSDRDRCMY